MSKPIGKLRKINNTLLKIQVGPQGLPGLNGSPGMPGLDGRNGKDGKAGTNGLNGIPGPRGERGEKGDKGDKPDHKWSGTRLSFERPNGTWGPFIDLQGQGGGGHRVGGGPSYSFLEGVVPTLTSTELNFVDGVTSSIQFQLDSKVIRAGDTMTGAFGLANLANAINSGAYSLQMKSGVTDGVSAVGYTLDTANSLATNGARFLKLLNAGTQELALGKYFTAAGNYPGTGMEVRGHIAVGESASVSATSIFNVSGDMINEGAALNATSNITMNTPLGSAQGFNLALSYVGGTGASPLINGVTASVRQSTATNWGGTPGGDNPAIYTGRFFSAGASGGTGAMGVKASIYQAKSSSFTGATAGIPTGLISFESQITVKASVTTYGFYDWGNSYGMWLDADASFGAGKTLLGGIILNGNSVGGDIVFGAGQKSSIYYDGTDFQFDSRLAGTGDFNFKNGRIKANNVVRLKGYTVATLPAGTQGDTAFVTDALAPAFLVAVAGGGAVVTTVFYNGAAWVAQ